MAEKKGKNSNSKRGGNSSFTDDFLNAIDKDNIVSNAQDIINSAVNVLEEEIAAGILAAKKIEKKVIDVDDVRQNQDELMNRIRRDTHEAVDLFIDALTAVTKHVSNLSSTLDKQQNGTPRQRAEPAESNGTASRNAISYLEADGPLKPGEYTSLSYIVSDAQADEPFDINIQKTEFTGPGRQFIYSRALSVNPSSFTLVPGGEIEISIEIKVPKNAIPGRYHAILTDSNGHEFRAVIGLEVAE